MTRLHGPRDRGSIPLALLVAIVVGGIIATTGALMATSQSNTRFDRSYTGALQVADTGVQTAIALANSGGDLSPCNGTSTDPLCSGTSGSGTYRWSVTTDPSDSNVRYVTSEGLVDGVTREVVATIRTVPRFPVAAFGDLFVQLVGNNTVTSYDSATQTPSTGNGSVASNGNVQFNGNSTTVDSVALYNHDASDNTCTSKGGSGCTGATTTDEKLELASDGSMAFIDQTLATCAAAGPLPSWRASVNGTTLSPSPSGFYCFERMDFDEDTTISGTAANPVIAYVRGGINIEPGEQVNCLGCTENSMPTTSNLLIFSAGTTDTEAVGIGNQSSFAGGIYAPRAPCVGNNSGAQAKIFGALICGRIGDAGNGVQGGWTFKYDDSLGRVGGSGISLERFDEN